MHAYMAEALKLAEKGRFSVAGNPMVGCVIVRDDKVIATGYHKKFGQNHAEINALEKLDFNAKNASVYITLEPCSFHGKTPPCVDAIINSAAKQVIIASLDNNPKVNSIGRMKEAGIEVITGVLEGEANTLNRGFFKRMACNMPFVSCKIASSLDGKTALSSGESKWITSEFARDDVQTLRAKNQAIISGSGTVLADNPQLNVRDKTLPSPIKVIMDRSGKITDKRLNIFKQNPPIITNKNPKQVLQMLAGMEVNNVLIEAGAKLSGAFLEAGLIDEFIIYQAPVIMGSTARSMLNIDIKNIQHKVELKLSDIRMIGTDLKIIARP